MEEKMAREMMPIYAGDDPVRIYKGKEPPKKQRLPGRHAIENFKESFIRRYGILLIAAAAFTIYTIILSASVEARTEKRVWTEARAEYAAQLEAYKAEQAEEVQKSYFLSGDASREAAINQAIDAAARLAGAMSNDTQKGGIVCNALARVMSSAYPNSLQEVISQPDQWMFYSPDNKFSEHDREIAEKILRPYFENGVIPSGLTADYVYGSWSENDYVLRNTWDFSSSTRTWRYQG